MFKVSKKKTLGKGVSWRSKHQNDSKWCCSGVFGIHLEQKLTTLELATGVSWN